MSQLVCGAIMLREVAVRQATSAIPYMNHMVVLTVLHLIRNVMTEVLSRRHSGCLVTLGAVSVPNAQSMSCMLTCMSLHGHGAWGCKTRRAFTWACAHEKLLPVFTGVHSS
jgi:hypothetical protein